MFLIEINPRAGEATLVIGTGQILQGTLVRGLRHNRLPQIDSLVGPDVAARGQAQ